MRNIFKIFLNFFLFLFVLVASGHAQTEYRIGQKETLSEILYRLNIRPIYGRKGSLVKALELNPHIKNPGDLIYPGQVIKLPDVLLPESVAKEESTSEPVTTAEESVLPGPEPESSAPITLPRSELRLALGGMIATLDSEEISNSQGNLLSHLSPGIQVGWNKFLSDKYQFSLMAESFWLNFKEPNNAILKNKTQSLIRAEVGVSRILKENFLLGVKFIYSETVLDRALDMTTVKMDKLALPGFGVMADWKKTADKKIFGVRPEIDLFLPASKSPYKTKTSLGAGIVPYFRYSYSEFDFFVEPFFRTKFLKSNIADYTMNEYGAFLGATFFLGK